MITGRHMTKFAVFLMLMACLSCIAAGIFSAELKEAQTIGTEMEYETALFDADEIMQVNILMEEEEWKKMLENAISEEYYPCDVEINGTVVSGVGIRPKGNTSLTSVAADPDTDRYSFKLEFDQYVKGQTCFGLDKLILNNNYADATNMKEAVVYDMYRYLGADASLSNYAKVSINGEYWGVYLALEAVEESFLQRNYGSISGALYKPDSMDRKGGAGDKPDGAGPKGGAWEKPEDADLNGGAWERPEDVDLNGETWKRPQGAGPNGEAGKNPQGAGSDGEASENPQGVGPDGEVSENPQGAGSDGEVSENQQGAGPNGEVRENSNSADGNDGEWQMPDLPDMEGEFKDFGFFGKGFQKNQNGADLNYTDDNKESYSAIWESSVADTKGSGYKKVIEALKHISEGSDIEDYLDTDNILKYMAVHTFVVNLDSLSGTMAHNYYLYESDGKLNILPWDYNLAFGGMEKGEEDGASETVNFPIDTPFSGTEFFDAMLENEEYQKTYHAYLRQLAEEYVDGGDFDQTYQRICTQIDGLVETDPTAFYTYEEYTAGKETFCQVVRLRAESIRGQLEGKIPSTSEAQKEDPSALLDAGSIRLETMGVMNMDKKRGAF